MTYWDLVRSDRYVRLHHLPRNGQEALIGRFSTDPSGGRHRAFIGWIWVEYEGSVDRQVAKAAGFENSGRMTEWLDKSTTVAEAMLRLGTIVHRLNESGFRLPGERLYR
ncbi:MAG: hypothetical protein ACOCXX_04355 [Planctomycetota bacterium]